MKKMQMQVRIMEDGKFMTRLIEVANWK